ncbi:MAG: 16S rRNA (uracil(1498)-N(3))-methyltransferase [Peptococcaceae bacterium]|nr:16S rRNA (uracil(1498)-N(3))-methyltransferase [Peptococcaceae bacterium]
MHHFFLNHPLDDAALAAPFELTKKDYQHLFVLRLAAGEHFTLADGCGRVHLCEVVEASKNALTVRCLETHAADTELACQLVLLQGLPKRDKLELIIQKSVELGAAAIVPVKMARSNVKIDEKKADRKAERLHEIAKSAASQSKRGVIPAVRDVQTLRAALDAVQDADIKLICYEDETARGHLEGILPDLSSAKKIALLVGPEGGITPEEWQLARDAGFVSVSLGKRILRTETAGLALLSYLMLHLEHA